MKVDDEKTLGHVFIRKFVLSLLQIDEEKGSRFIREFAKLTSSPSMAVLDLREFPIPVRVEYPMSCYSGGGRRCQGQIRQRGNGYTVVDSRKVVENTFGPRVRQLFGATTERALVFTNLDGGQLAHDDRACE